MISFAVVEISLLFRCVLISGKQAGSVFCGADGVRLVGWANGVVFCSLPTLPVPVPSLSLPWGTRPVSASWEARRRQWLCPPGSS